MWQFTRKKSAAILFCLVVFTTGCFRSQDINKIGGTKLVFRLDGKLETPADEAAKILRERADPSGVQGIQVAITEPLIEISFPGKTFSEAQIQMLHRALATASSLEIRCVVEQTDSEIVAAANADPESQDVVVDGKVVATWRPISADSKGAPRINATPKMVVRTFPDQRVDVLLATSENDLLGQHVDFATKAFDERDMPSIACKFTKAGSKRMETLSSANQGRSLAIVIGGEAMAAPTLMSKVSERCAVTGNFTDEEASFLVTAIRFGALPFRVVDEPPKVIVVPKAGN